MIESWSDLDDKIVLWGMSCVGKTTFANSIDHYYYCFDALFPWHMIETLGLSIESALFNISRTCNREKYVIDGWHSSDSTCSLIPENACVYVIYAGYRDIINQYRVEVERFDMHFHMFVKWYCSINFPRARYFRNTGKFIEQSKEDFELFLVG